jgi:muramoyltetrapeptide carboxypeptidase
LLKPGDKIILVAPSGIVTGDYIQKAVKIFESWGLKVILGENLFSSYHQFAGTDEQRLSDIQAALDNHEISAVVCARGGYGLMRITDKINWNNLLKKPKWVVGFSDITVLHACLLKRSIQSIHSLMPINFNDQPLNSKPLEYLKKLLFDGTIEYTLPSNALNLQGSAKGIVTGGNLSLLYALMGTPLELKTDERILFIEDVGEQLYHLDRMIQSLRLAGKFDKIKAMIVGGLTEMTDKKIPFGFSPEEIITSVAKQFSFPVVFGFPAGHIKDNCPLLLGSEVSLNCENKSVSIQFN